ncbi:POS5 [Candida theae]|uniref:POS5 n=1 Tax=Candida theae TaxID=1198502 RepID=A0AAD5BGE5_9ASCO|nr:POS5 [Candida theae]KAI5961484.1 POS5 [Candida theae]
MRGSESKLTMKSCRDLPSARFPEYIKSANNRLYNVIWSEGPLSNVFLVKKPWEPSVRDAMVELINHLHVSYPCVNVIVDENVADELMSEGSSVDKQLDSKVEHVVYTGTKKEIISKTDLLITLGGDGTILRGVSLFSNVQVPPVLSFAMGTLGFLLPFDFKNCMSCFALVYENRAQALHRNRLECHVVRNADTKVCHEAKEEEVEVATVRNKRKRSVTEMEESSDHPVAISEKQEMIHAMNDITIHRGSSPNLTSLDIYIDNEFFTTTYADGLIFSTPTGSTAYSLSAGGSITHPAVACILLTPICPRSLSFRPLILPCSSDIMVRLSKTNRSSFIELTVDGISQQDLHPGDELHITSETVVVENDKIKKQKRNNGRSAEAGEYSGDGVEYNDKNGIWCVATNQNQWSKDLNSLLGFNSSFKGQQNKKSHL